MEKELTRHSPKNPYRIELNFTPALANSGSVLSFGTAGNRETAIALADKEAAFYRSSGHEGEIHIRIFHNNKTYPEFDWEKIADYYDGRSGGMRAGAGRKHCDKILKRRTTSFRFSPRTLEQISKLKERGVNVSRFLEEKIDDAAKDLK